MLERLEEQETVRKEWESRIRRFLYVFGFEIERVEVGWVEPWKTHLSEYFERSHRDDGGKRVS